ncbi:MAG: type II toxin-antitoxin system MqsA family antitoxin [Gammaproteobacteria bacterium]|jgi:putative transcriptional regulator|nr:type II toxin-antitoxin system MqsA family antitoxin [Gammaproteobacteria bacterium]
MKDDVFKKITDGAKEAIAIEKGVLTPARTSVYFGPHEIKQIRTKLKMSQREFSDRFGIPIETIRHWEQGRRQPDRAAMAFYQVLEKQPKAALEAFA